jgi:hypothetical protein
MPPPCGLQVSKYRTNTSSATYKVSSGVEICHHVDSWKRKRKELNNGSGGIQVDWEVSGVFVRVGWIGVDSMGVCEGRVGAVEGIVVGGSLAGDAADSEKWLLRVQREGERRSGEANPGSQGDSGGVSGSLSGGDGGMSLSGPGPGEQQDRELAVGYACGELPGFPASYRDGGEAEDGSSARAEQDSPVGSQEHLRMQPSGPLPVPAELLRQVRLSCGRR